MHSRSGDRERDKLQADHQQQKEINEKKYTSHIGDDEALGSGRYPLLLSSFLEIHINKGQSLKIHF
jgi:hypothetical protein